MRDVSRRDAVKLAAGLTVGAGAATASAAPAAKRKPPADAELEMARQSIEAYMFGERVTSKIDETGYSRDLIVTSALSEGRPTQIHVRPMSVRIFRADAAVDAFTQKGGIHWRFADTLGRTQFTTPGALVLVVRDGTGTVHWYSLTIDMRC